MNNNNEFNRIKASYLVKKENEYIALDNRQKIVDKRE